MARELSKHDGVHKRSTINAIFKPAPDVGEMPASSSASAGQGLMNPESGSR